MIRKRIKTTRLIDIFPEFLTAGPFAVLASITGIELPWAEVITAPELDILYIGEHSGEKIVSPLIDKLLEIDEGEITEAHLKAILGAIYNKNALNWSRLWEAVNTEYDPLENYSMLEKHTGTDTKVNTPTNRKETETQTPNNWIKTETKTPTNWKETETQSPDQWKTTSEGLKADNETEVNKSFYGDDSSDPSPSNKEVTSSKNKETTTQSGTFETTTEQSGQFVTTEGQAGTYTTERTKSGTEEDKTTYNTELERSGNIGVTTSQQMLESEFMIRAKNFFDRVFADFDAELTIPIYC